MRRIMLAVCLVLIMVSTAFGQQQWTCPPNWSAYGCPTWTCPQNPDPVNPPDVCTPVTLQEMGSFDSNGVWIYNSLYLTQMANWGPDNASAFPEAWKPVKELVFSGNPTLQSYFKSDGSKATRVNFNLPENAVMYPEVYRWIRGSTHQTFVASFTSTEIPNSVCQYLNGSAIPCTYPAFTKKYSLGLVPFESIQGIYWAEKNLVSGPPVKSFQNQMSVLMDLSTPPTPSPNYSSVRGSFNFWQSPITFPLSGYKVMALWSGVVPENGVETTIQVNIGNTPYNLVFAGGNTEDIPPIIPLTSVITGQKTNVEKGKVKDKILNVTVDNLLVSPDADGNLVISWTGPPVSTPYMNLNVYVGSLWPAGTLPEEAYFAWINSPPQASSVVLPKLSWDKIKSTLLTEGYPKAQVSIFYQHLYMKPPTASAPQGTTFQVRGQSDIVEIPY